MDEKRKAALFIVALLRTPLALLSPDRQKARELAERYNLTALDLLDAAHKKARDT